MSPASRARFWLALTYLLIVGLVIGGLGWVTAAALRIERSDQLRLALWRLDSRVGPSLAREDSRPFQHFDPLYVPLPALQRDGAVCSAGSVLVPSPLLSAALPDWMLLHFQATEPGPWRSPQAPSTELLTRLRQPGVPVDLGNVTPVRGEWLKRLQGYSVSNVLARIPDDSSDDSEGPPIAVAQQSQVEAPAPQSGQLWTPNRDNDYQQRDRVQRATKAELSGNALNNRSNVQSFQVAPLDQENFFTERDGKWSTMNPVALLNVKLGAFHPVWIRADGQPDLLTIARVARPGKLRVVQGVLLDWPSLRDILLDEIRDLFPDARLEPVLADEETNRDRMMTALPIRLDPGGWAAPVWSPLRTGLLLAWLAAIGALTVVGFGGRALLELSERRIRFVSAVTHELRTPLTTLRLYLDMLNSGLVSDDAKRSEYLHTLDAESDRLNRLVGNVLAFARLERQRPQLVCRDVAPRELLDRAQADWAQRCRAAGKSLVVETHGDSATPIATDPELVQQILGNLIDNACKYTREAADDRVWLRSRRDGGAVVFEVEDRGPGVPPRDRRGIFQAFRRGQSADVTAGGVGLGLALARRWAELLGGRLEFVPGRDGAGSCFQLRLCAVRSPGARA